jgi:negative regulator of sigma E activity
MRSAWWLLLACALGRAQERGVVPAAAPDVLIVRMLEGPAQQYRATVVFGAGSVPASAELVLGEDGLHLRASDALALGTQTVLPLHTAKIADAQAQTLAAALMQSYVPQWQGEERIANRQTRRVMFVPKDGWRYRYRLWLDEQTGMTLRRELYQQQELVEQIVTTSIALDNATRAPVESGKNSAPMLSSRAFSVRKLPSGFVLTASNTQPQRAHQLFSDGLANVSVFAQSAGQFSSNVQGKRGAIGMLVKRMGVVEFVAIGDVPDVTLALFLADVQPAD